MPITHNSDQEIMDTIRAIAKKGVMPTVKILHRILGGGSSQRLSQFIKLWKKEYIENLKKGNSTSVEIRKKAATTLIRQDLKKKCNDASPSCDSFVSTCNTDVSNICQNGADKQTLPSLTQPSNGALSESIMNNSEYGATNSIIEKINTFFENKYTDSIKKILNLEMQLKESEESEKKSRTMLHRIVEEYSRLLSEHRACIDENKAYKEKLFKVYNYLNNKNIGLNAQQIEII